jgi:hypothetical protein
VKAVRKGKKLNNENKRRQDKTSQQIHLPGKCGRKNSRIQNEINERIRKDSQFYQLIPSI